MHEGFEGLGVAGVEAAGAEEQGLTMTNFYKFLTQNELWPPKLALESLNLKINNNNDNKNSHARNSHARNRVNLNQNRDKNRDKNRNIVITRNKPLI